MGLDSVELLIAFEDEFGISIDDADAARLTSPRQAADYVAYRLGAANGRKARCLFQVGFHRLRAVLVRQFGAKRSDVRPDAPITDFLTGRVRTQWRELRSAIGNAQLPDLECGQTMLGLLSVGVPLLSGVLMLSNGVPLWAGIPVMIALWLGGMFVSTRVGNKVPAALTTVGAIAPYVNIFSRDEWVYEDILGRVIQLTALYVDTPVDRIKPEDEFIKDLGLD